MIENLILALYGSIYSSSTILNEIVGRSLYCFFKFIKTKTDDVTYILIALYI